MINENAEMMNSLTNVVLIIYIVIILPVAYLFVKVHQQKTARDAYLKSCRVPASQDTILVDKKQYTIRDTKNEREHCPPSSRRSRREANGSGGGKRL